jgi:hypothetical protein
MGLYFTYKFYTRIYHTFTFHIRILQRCWELQSFRYLHFFLFRPFLLYLSFFQQWCKYIAHILRQISERQHETKLYHLNTTNIWVTIFLLNFFFVSLLIFSCIINIFKLLFTLYLWAQNNFPINSTCCLFNVSLYKAYIVRAQNFILPPYSNCYQMEIWKCEGTLAFIDAKYFPSLPENVFKCCWGEKMARHRCNRTGLLFL